jgi:hypothetical protein
MTGPLVPALRDIPVGMGPWVRTVKAAIDLLQKQQAQAKVPLPSAKFPSPLKVIGVGGIPRLQFASPPTDWITTIDGAAMEFISPQGAGAVTANVIHDADDDRVEIVQGVQQYKLGAGAFNHIALASASGPIPGQIIIEAWNETQTDNVAISLAQTGGINLNAGATGTLVLDAATIAVQGTMDFAASGQDLHCNPIPTTASAANVFMNASNGLITRSTSSRRYKSKIRKAPTMLGVLDRLKAVVYKSKTEYKEQGGDAPDYVGFIAEDVDKIPGGSVFVGRMDIDGESVPDSVHYASLVVPLVQAYQQHTQQIADLTARIEKLEAR